MLLLAVTSSCNLVDNKITKLLSNHLQRRESGSLKIKKLRILPVRNYKSRSPLGLLTLSFVPLALMPLDPSSPSIWQASFLVGQAFSAHNHTIHWWVCVHNHIRLGDDVGTRRHGQTEKANARRRMRSNCHWMMNIANTSWTKVKTGWRASKLR